MRCLETFARAYGLPKVMLTVFEGAYCPLAPSKLFRLDAYFRYPANVEARTFYKRINYENDEICPSNYEYTDADEKPDYLILSRSIRPRSSRNKKKKRPTK